MPLELRGVAAALCLTEDFLAAEPLEVEAALQKADASVRLRFTDEGVGTPLVRSGEAFTHLLLVQSGVVVPWQQPPSELRRPFLIGIHELLMGSKRWVATYSAVAESTIVEIPREALGHVLDALPSVREQMLKLLLYRISRFYWTSLSTTGSPRARVAAALVSRLGIRGEDFGRNREIRIRQIDLVRLTALSRTAVASGLRDLVESELVKHSGRSHARYFSGRLVVPDVDALKDAAFADVRANVIERFESPAQNT